MSPGYVEENKVKPKITLKIEESDTGLNPEVIAGHLLRGRSLTVYINLILTAVAGVEKGQFHITYDFIGNVFRTSTRGSSPGNNSLLDQVYSMIGAVRVIYPQSIVDHLFKSDMQIALPIWRKDVDKQVRAHADEHHQHLASQGLLVSSGASK